MSEPNSLALIPAPQPGPLQPVSGDAALTSGNVPQQSAIHLAAQQKSLPLRPGEPPRLLASKATNPAWLKWVEAGLPGSGARLESLPERYGADAPTITKTLDIIDDLIGEPRAGVPRFLDELKATSQDAYDELVKAARNDPVEAEARKMAAALNDDYHEAHMRELRKWRPFADEARNQDVRSDVLAAAVNRLFSREYYRAMYDRAVELLMKAAKKRLAKEDDSAEMREVHGLAKEFNQDLGAVMLEYIRR